MKQKSRRKVNSGFSLIELIVVLLILGILSGGAVISLSMISRQRANACADRLSKLLDQTRLETMSRVDGSVSMELLKLDGSYFGIIYLSGEAGTEVELGSGALTIRIMNGTQELYTISESQPLKVQFQKGSGSFLFDESEGYPIFTSIRIDGSNSKTVRIYRETGRNRIE